jgi:hypothetical protein
MKVIGHRPADYATMAESVALAVAIEAGLRLTSVARLLAWLEQLRPRRRRLASPASYSLDRFAAAAYRLLPFKATCLRESLVLYALLRRRGEVPRLCVGVKKDGIQLSAHAWIACDGFETSLDEATVLADYFVMFRTNAPS